MNFYKNKDGLYEIPDDQEVWCLLPDGRTAINKYKLSKRPHFNMLPWAGMCTDIKYLYDHKDEFDLIDGIWKQKPPQY